MTKKCVKCKEVKSKDKFSICKSSLDGLQGYCKQCNKKYQKIRHDRSNSTRKIYRLVIEPKDLKLNDPNNYEKFYYIGFTSKELSDRLNAHISDIRNKKHKNYFIMKLFENVDVSNINLRKNIYIELIREYPSTTSAKEMLKHEKREVYLQCKQSCLVEKNTSVLNEQHYGGNKNVKEFLIEYDTMNKNKKNTSEIGDNRSI